MHEKAVLSLIVVWIADSRFTRSYDLASLLLDLILDYVFVFVKGLLDLLICHPSILQFQF